MKMERARRRWFPALLGLILAGLVVALPLSARPAAAQTEPRAGGALVSLNGQWIRQGHAGFVTVRGENIADVRAVFQGRLYHFYPEGNRYVGLISVDVATDVGDEPLQVETDGVGVAAQVLGELPDRRGRSPFAQCPEHACRGAGRHLGRHRGRAQRLTRGRIRHRPERSRRATAHDLLGAAGLRCRIIFHMR